MALANASDEPELMKCQSIGLMVVKLTVGAKTVSNIEPLVTWRASCAEKPPVAPVGGGNVIALCDGDLISKNGATRRIFYWQINKPSGEENIGYHLCPR